MSEPTEEIAELSTLPSSELDTVFDNFFQLVEELPPIPKPRSAKDYLETNRAKIIHALSKGYTYEDLAKLLNDCGFSISASTLRRYMGPVKGRKGDELTKDLIPDAGVFCMSPRKGGIAKTIFGIITFKSLSAKLFPPMCLRNYTFQDTPELCLF